MKLGPGGFISKKKHDNSTQAPTRVFKANHRYYNKEHERGGQIKTASASPTPMSSRKNTPSLERQTTVLAPAEMAKSAALAHAQAPPSVPEADAVDSPADKPDADAYWPTIANKSQIPGWLRDNDFIIGGHPMPTYSYRRSFRLWRCLHMETMNIWTHVLGSIGFVVAGFALYGCARHAHTSLSSKASPTLNTGDKLAFASSLTTSALCFALSAGFHTLRSHSYNVHHFWGKLDILGISLLAIGGGTSATYYAFYCRVTLQRVYWGLNLGCGLAAAITLFETGGGGSKMRALRGGVFSLLAAAAMVPIFHFVGTTGWVQACAQIGLWWYLAELLALLLGVGLFVGRIPERFVSGCFDTWGHSHQLFHMCAVAGMAFHLGALVVSFKYRQEHPICS